MPTLTIAEARDLAARALANAGASEAMATTTAAALVDAEAQGLSSHGLARVAQYATHLRNGRADGKAVATVVHERGGAVLIDAQCGLAFPACALAVEEGIGRARKCGVAFAGVTIVAVSYIGIALLPDVAIHTSASNEPQHAGLWRGVFAHKNIAGPVMACFSFAGLYLMRRGRHFLGAVLLVSAVIFVVSGSWNLITVAILGLVENADLSQAAAFSLVLVVIVLAVLGLLQHGVGRVASSQMGYEAGG